MAMSTSWASEVLNSPRAQRRILIVSGAVFAVGLVVFLSTVVLRNSNGPISPLSTQPAQTAPHLVKVKPPPAAYAVARKFLETAVLRKNLDASYALMDPAMTGTLTRKQWDRGLTTIIPYPAGNVKSAAFLVDWSYNTQIMLEVDLVARRGTHVRPELDFFLGLRRKDGKPDGVWRVNYWAPNWRPPLPYGGPG